MQTTNDVNATKQLSAIDLAIAAAKARKAAKGEPTGDEAEAKKPKVKTHPDVVKEQRKQANDALRAAAKAKREAEREERRSKREAQAQEKAGRPAHMKKVNSAASKLPGLNEDANRVFDEVTTNFSAEQISAIALHLQHFNRAKATERALTQKVEVGSRVRIMGGDPKFIGQEGTVSNVRRIRCFVDVPGAKKPVYLFTSDVSVVEEEIAQSATGTEG
jgi:hypothetical protein